MQIFDQHGNQIKHIDRQVSFRDSSRYGPYYRRQYPDYRTTPYRQPQYRQPDLYFRPQEPRYDPWENLPSILAEAGIRDGDASGLRSIDFPIDPFISSQDTYDASHLRSENYYDVFETTDQIMERQGLRQTNIPGIYDAEEISNHGRNLAYEMGEKMWDRFESDPNTRFLSTPIPLQTYTSPIENAVSKGLDDFFKSGSEPPPLVNPANPFENELNTKLNDFFTPGTEPIPIQEQTNDFEDRLKGALDDFFSNRALNEDLNQIKQDAAKEQTQAKDTTVTRLNLQQVYPGNDRIFTRPGFEGKFVKQLDGSFWYTGDQATNQSRATYVDGAPVPGRVVPLPFTNEILQFNLFMNSDGSFSGIDDEGKLYPGKFLLEGLERIYYTGGGKDSQGNVIPSMTYESGQKKDRTNPLPTTFPLADLIRDIGIYLNNDRKWVSPIVTGEFILQTEKDGTGSIFHTGSDDEEVKPKTYIKGRWDKKRTKKIESK